MQAGQDRIIDNARTLAFFKRIASADAQVIDYPEGHHTLEFDPDPDRYAQDLVNWLDNHPVRSQRVGNQVHGTQQA
jgi:alpha-beta hydrolase superfamily lysophospholipase